MTLASMTPCKYFAELWFSTPLSMAESQRYWHDTCEAMRAAGEAEFGNNLQKIAIINYFKISEINSIVMFPRNV